MRQSLPTSVHLLVRMLASPNLLLGPAYGVPHHIPGPNNATTPVGMYIRYRISPSEAIDVIQGDKANQLVCVCLFECSLAPIFCSDLLMVCLTTYRAITMPQHPLACILVDCITHVVGDLMSQHGPSAMTSLPEIMQVASLAPVPKPMAR